MTHTRACPVCGVIVEWTRGEPRTVTTVAGTVIHGVVRLSLSCLEHGPFDNISGKLNTAFERLERGLKGAID